MNSIASMWFLVMMAFSHQMPLLDVRDPQLLAQLEGHPSNSLSFNNILYRIAGKTQSVGLKANATLYQDNPIYQALVERLHSDLRPFDQSLGTPSVKINADAKKFPDGNVARQFDERWLKSPWGYFLLTGIINRYDRKDFKAGNCGEVRFIYRLAYKKPAASGKAYASRLPFFLSFVFEYPAQSNCSPFARIWQAPENMKPDQQISWLLSTPLDFKKLRFKQLEFNAQVVRFPAALTPDTAGHAIYLLHEYRARLADESIHFEALPLENTPDVQRLTAHPQLKEELVAFIRNNISDIDIGVFRLPDKFLATEALSFSTMGNMRLANKPFDAIFQNAEVFSNLPFEKLSFVKSPQGLIERLNNATCMGCHQGNSTAGFHFMGRDREGFFGPTNEIRLETSPHYHTEQGRRLAYFQDVLAGKSPSLLRPLSYVPSQSGAGVNEPCIINVGTHFHHVWHCKSEDLECRAVVQNPSLNITVGQCVPKKSDLLFSGQTCREGVLSDSKKINKELPFNFFSFKDTFNSHQLYNLPENKVFTTSAFNCRPTEIGVPLGRTFRNCKPEERGLQNFSSEKIPSEICALVGGSAFDRCAEGNFHDCLAQIVVRGALDTCHQNRFCREDYMCQTLPPAITGVSPGIRQKMDRESVGFCTPTYFLYQMRLDGHVTPE